MDRRTRIPTRSVRYPMLDLERLLGWPLAREMAEIAEVSFDTLGQWKSRGLSHAQADKVATKFGFHPIEVWGESWLEAERVPSSEPIKVIATTAKRPTVGFGSPSNMAERGAAAWRERVSA